MNDLLTALVIGPRSERQLKTMCLLTLLLIFVSFGLIVIERVSLALACWALLACLWNLTSIRVWCHRHLDGSQKPRRGDIILLLANVVAAALSAATFVRNLRDAGVL